MLSTVITILHSLMALISVLFWAGSIGGWAALGVHVHVAVTAS